MKMSLMKIVNGWSLAFVFIYGVFLFFFKIYAKKVKKQTFFIQNRLESLKRWGTGSHRRMFTDGHPERNSSPLHIRESV